MAYVTTNDLKAGMKVEIDGQPYNVTLNEFVKPGKGQAFNRVKIKHLLSGKVLERTFKSGEKIDLADVAEVKMRMLYKEASEAVFMDDNSFEQVSIPLDNIGEDAQWLMDDRLYDIIIYNGTPAQVLPPTFMELKIVESAPGVKGDTASGRVTKPAVLESGAKIQVPIFIEEGEIIRVDTRTAEYVSRVGK